MIISASAQLGTRKKEEWLFSIVDVVSALTDQPTQRNASTYWAVMKNRLKKEGAI